MTSTSFEQLQQLQPASTASTASTNFSSFNQLQQLQQLRPLVANMQPNFAWQRTQLNQNLECFRLAPAWLGLTSRGTSLQSGRRQIFTWPRQMLACTNLDRTQGGSYVLGPSSASFLQDSSQTSPGNEVSPTRTSNAFAWHQFGFRMAPTWLGHRVLVRTQADFCMATAWPGPSMSWVPHKQVFRLLLADV